VVEVRPSVGKIVQATFVEKYHTSVVKGMVFGFENRNLEFLSTLVERNWRKCVSI